MEVLPPPDAVHDVGPHVPGFLDQALPECLRPLEVLGELLAFGCTDSGSLVGKPHLGGPPTEDTAHLHVEGKDVDQLAQIREREQQLVEGHPPEVLLPDRHARDTIPKLIALGVVSRLGDPAIVLAPVEEGLLALPFDNPELADVG